MSNRYHCCATCKHFRIEIQENRRKRIYCERLGFDTKSEYQFNCWNPKERVKKAVEKPE